MRTKDNTPTQAASWVIQEASKHSDRTSIEKRIATEKASIVLFAQAGSDKSPAEQSSGPLQADRGP